MYVHCVHFIIQFYINTCSINTVINTFLWYFYLYLQKCACYSLHGSKEQNFNVYLQDDEFIPVYKKNNYQY